MVQRFHKIFKRFVFSLFELASSALGLIVRQFPVLCGLRRFPLVLALLPLADFGLQTLHPRGRLTNWLIVHFYFPGSAPRRSLNFPNALTPAPQPMPFNPALMT